MDIFKKSFVKLGLFAPRSNFFHETGSENSFGASNHPYLNEKLDMSDKCTRCLEYLETKVQKKILIAAAVGIVFAFFQAFSPVIAILGLIILYQVLAILRIHFKTHFFKRRGEMEEMQCKSTESSRIESLETRSEMSSTFHSPK